MTENPIISRMQSGLNDGSLIEHFGPIFSPDRQVARANEMAQTVLELADYANNSPWANCHRFSDRFGAISVDDDGVVRQDIFRFRYESIIEIGQVFGDKLYFYPHLEFIHRFATPLSQPEKSDNRRIDLAYRPQSGSDKFVYMQGEKGISCDVCVSDPSSPVAQEEFLHAAEGIIRGTVKHYDDTDEYLFSAVDNAVHSAIVLDWVLTAAAKEMGDFTYWSERAAGQTKLDQEYLKTFTPDRFLNPSFTFFGTRLNQRFQYPQITEEYLDVVVANLAHSMEATWFHPDGSFNHDMYSMAELVMLAYGSNHLEIIKRLLDCGDVINGQIVNAGRAAIELGKQLLTLYKGSPEEEELLRHHQPVKIGFSSEQLKYQVSDTKRWLIIGWEAKRLPIVFTIRDIKRQGMLNSALKQLENMKSQLARK